MARAKQSTEESTGRSRARRLYPERGVCEFDGCEQPAYDRHHIDENPQNNAPENIKFLCRRHHIETHDLLTKLHEAARKPPRPCSNCGEMVKRIELGRCHRCYEYHRKNGYDNPEPRRYANYGSAKTPR